MPITLAQPAMHMLRRNSLNEAHTRLFEYTHLDHQSLMLTSDELKHFGATALEEIKDYSSVDRLIKAFQIAKLIRCSCTFFD